MYADTHKHIRIIESICINQKSKENLTELVK